MASRDTNKIYIKYYNMFKRFFIYCTQNLQAARVMYNVIKVEAY